MLDQTSLFISIGCSAAALTLTLVLSWFGARSSRYLLSWALGLGLIVPGVVLYGIVDGYDPALHYASFALLLAGFGAIAIGAAQFRNGDAPTAPAILLWLGTSVTMGLAYLAGLNGLGTIIANLACATFFILAAREHWHVRTEALALQWTMIGLYAVTALSFLACAVQLVAFGQFTLTERPSNWAEDFNTIAIIIVLPAAGAMAMALHQSRGTAAQRLMAMTDALTGLLNRRALFNLHGITAIPHGAVVVMLDLDGFKTINDRFGHAVGDEVLCRFASIVRHNIRESDTAARLGGEEFCLVMPGLDPADGHAVVERIRAGLEATAPLSADFGPPTVSAGIALSAIGTDSFDRLLREADRRLYRAKHAGRNRVFGPSRRLAA